MANQDWYEYESNDDAPGRKRLAPKPPPVRLRRPPASAPQRAGVAPIVFVLLCLALSAAVMLPVGLGVVNGLRERDDLIFTSAEDHYQRALNYQAENYPELALAELQLALKYNPNYAPARQKLLELQNVSATSSAQGPLDVAEQLFKQATLSVQNEAWDDAISELEEVRSADPTFQKDQVEQMLFQAYSGSGKRAVVAGNIELARQRFESALTLQPDDPTAKQQLDLARSYLDGQQAIGYDWGTAVTSFQSVYQQDPNYFDVKNQLVNALLGNGDIAAKQGAWCIAAREYDHANQISPSSNLAANAAQANENCRAAVLAPTATPTATPNPELTPTVNPLPNGIVIGEVLFTVHKSYDTSAKCPSPPGILGHVYDNAGHPLANISLKYDNLQGATAPTKTNPDGSYYFILGKDAGIFYLAIIAPDGKTTQGIEQINYPGGSAVGCRIAVDWTRIK